MLYASADDSSTFKERSDALEASLVIKLDFITFDMSNHWTTEGRL